MLPLTASGAARPRYGGALRLSFSQAAENYDPALAANLPERLLSGAVYETLTVFSVTNAAEQAVGIGPGLATSWQTESGGKRWVFQLRSDVRFHNGSRLSAAAVRASLERTVARAQTAAAAQLRRVQFLCASPEPGRLACDMSEPLAALPGLLADPALAIADADAAGTGPWKMAAWTKGTHARLEAFDDYSGGRPYLDSIEADFGIDPRRQRVDYELKRADVLVAAPTEARVPGLSRTSPLTNLLLLGFHPNGPFAAGDAGTAARRALSAALDRDALARLLPPGRAEAADGFLPDWLSGYEFLFRRPNAGPAAAAPALPRGTVRLIHDASDPAARLIASRLALDLRALGLELRADALPHAAYAAARDAGQYDLYLESTRLQVNGAAFALADLFQRYDISGDRPPGLSSSQATVPGQGRRGDMPVTTVPGILQLFSAGSAPSVRVEAQYRAERDALDGARVVPLLHYRDAYSFQPGLEQVTVNGNGQLDLANAWKR